MKWKIEFSFRYLYAIPGAAFLGGYAAGYQMGYPEIHTLAYLGSSLCCVGALAGLSAQRTSRLGNTLGMIGVSGGMATTLGLLNPNFDTLTQMGMACGLGMLSGFFHLFLFNSMAKKGIFSNVKFFKAVPLVWESHREFK